MLSKVQRCDVMCPESSILHSDIAILSISFWFDNGSGFAAICGSRSVKSKPESSLLDCLVALALQKKFFVLLVEQSLEPAETRGWQVPSNVQGLADCD